MNLVPLPVVVPLAGAAVILFLNNVLPRRCVQAMTLLFVVAEIALAVALFHQTRDGTVVYWFGGWTPRTGVALGISFTVDQAGAGGALLAGIVTAAAVATTHWTIDAAHGFVHALMLSLLAAMAGFCLTGDLFNMFVFFELMAVSAFALAAFSTASPAGLRSALNFAITNSIGAFLVLIGVALLYSRTGALNLAQIGRQLAGARTTGRLAITAFAFITVGLLIKAAVVPFHFWLVDTASTAPLPLVMILAGVLDTLGVYGVARIYWTVFATTLDPHHQAVQAVLVTLGVISAVVGATMALLFGEPRRRLGFVLVSHTGILLIGVGCLTTAGLAGAAVYAIGDGTLKAALFVGLALVGAGASGVSVSAVKRRCGVALLVAGGLGLAGLPLFATGLGKAAIEGATSAVGYRWVTPVIILAAVLTAAAVLELAWSTSDTTAPTSQDEPVAPTAGWVLPYMVGATLLGVSVAATLLGRWATRAAYRFVDTTAYRQVVLGGPVVGAAGLVRLPATIGLSAGDVLVDLLSALAAVALAVVWHRFGVPDRQARHRPVALLARFHDGRVGDSVTWATLGAAVLGVVFASGLH